MRSARDSSSDVPDGEGPPTERTEAASELAPTHTPVPRPQGLARIGDRFVLQSLLGRGASGEVYRAFDEARGATIALKFLTDLDPGALFRFKSEFRALCNLAHPNLLQLNELVACDDDWLLSMELVDGGDFMHYVRPHSRREDPADPTLVVPQGTDQHTADLSDLGSQTRSLPPDALQSPFDELRLRAALRQLAEGLHTLHRADRLHRDVKPANVLVSAADDRVVICDFGLALTGTRGLGADAESRYDVPREVAGTLQFMAPEQARAHALGPAADWYSVGVMLYLALTGRMPFPKPLTVRASIEAKLHGRPVHPRSVDSRVPDDLAELALALMAPDPQARAGYPQLLAALEGAGQRAPHRAREAVECVGRDEELAALRAAFEHSRRGSPALALVSGVSGMGKSSLVSAFLSEIESDAGALVLRARCYEREEVPYKALDPLMDALSTQLMRMPRDAVERVVPTSLQFLAALFPALKRVRAIDDLQDGGEQVADVHERRRLAFRSFHELCRRLAQSQPLVLFIDDLQWGDLDSAALFQELLAPHAPLPLLIVCAYRSEDAGSALLAVLRGMHERDPAALHLVEVSVGALDRKHATQLAADLLHRVAGAERSAELIACEADGSPFFIRELAAYVDEHGIAAAQHIRLDALIRDKLAALSPDSRELLAAIALAGKPLAQSTLRLAAKLGPATFKALRDLERRRLVTTHTGRDERVECHHDRIREAACADLPELTARRVHRALAEAFEQTDADDCDALLEHWRGAGEPERALRYALLGAEKAETALAFDRAAALCRAALSLLPTGDARERALRERRGRLLVLAGRGLEAAAVFQSLIPGAPPASALIFRTLATAQLLRGGKLAEGFAELERADDLFGVRFPRSEPAAIAMLLARRARIAWHARAIRWHARPRERADGDRLAALWEVAAAVSNADMLRGSVYGAELMLRALAFGDPAHIAGACGLESIAAAAANDPAKVERMSALAEAAGKESGQLDLLGRVRGMKAICRQLQGRWHESVRLAHESQELHLRVARLNWDYAIMIWWEMTALSMTGQVGTMAARVPDALRDAEARGDVYAATGFRTHRSTWAWLALDRPETADAMVDVAEREWNPEGYQFQRWHMTYSRCEVDLYRGTPHRSFERLENEWGRSRLVRQVQGVRADMLYTRGRLALALAREHLDPKLIARARKDGRTLQGEGVPWAAALGTLVLAGAAAFDNKAAAVRLLMQAELQLNAADMAMHAAAARFMRGQLTAGTEGAAVVSAAAEHAAELGAKRPEAFMRMLLPMPGVGR